MYTYEKAVDVFKGRTTELQSITEKYRYIYDSVPISIRSIIRKISLDNLESIEEFRLKVGAPLIVYKGTEAAFVTEDGRLCSHRERAYVVTADDAIKALQLMSNFSIYSIEDELRNGFITLRGGHRVGIVGKVVTENGKVKTIKDISGLNIRVSRQVIGCSSRVIRHIIRDCFGVYNTLIISPPQCGKTTLLRDIIRQVSNGVPSIGYHGAKVGVVDERSEIAGCFRGVPQNDVGIRTDVLDACPKAQGIMMLIRSMSPSVIATDELGKAEDLVAVEEAVRAGVNILTTVHGWDREDAKRKPVIGRLMDDGVFERLVVLSRRKGPGTIEEVVDCSNGRLRVVCGGA
jgi:stage III sporulation protein AA